MHNVQRGWCTTETEIDVETMEFIKVSPGRSKRGRRRDAQKQRATQPESRRVSNEHVLRYVQIAHAIESFT